MELFLIILGIIAIFLVVSALVVFAIGVAILRITSEWWDKAEFFDED